MGNNYVDEDNLYDGLLLFLGDLKLVVGPDGLSATLRRHKDVANFLIQHQRRILSEFQERIENLG